MATQNRKDIYKIWMAIAAFVVIIAGIRSAATIITPLLLSVFIATLCAPAMGAIQRIGIPRFIAFFIVLSFVLALFFGFGYVFSTSLDGFLANMPVYREKIMGSLVLLQEFLQRFSIELSVKDLEKMLDPAGLLNLFGGFLKSFSTILSKSFLIFLGVTFMLFETSSLKTKIHLLIESSDDAKNPFDEFSQNLNNYLAIKTVISFLTALLITAGLLFLGLDFALLLGLIAFLLNYIPSIGAVIAAIPAVLVALVGADFMVVFWVVGLYLSINVIMGSIIEPRYLGRGLGLSVLVILISLIFWGWVLGPVGMFLAVPLSMSIKLALDAHPSTKPIAMLLSSVDSHSR